MTFNNLIRIELKKIKRSKILILLLIAPILIVTSGVSHISMYFTPEYNDAWKAMFIQSSLLFGYYLLPLSMVVVCVMISGIEIKNHGLMKMLTLPIDRAKLSIAKFFLLIIFLAIEIIIFLVVFLIAGFIATFLNNVTQGVPVSYLLTQSFKLFYTMIPCLSLMWAISISFSKRIFSIGFNLLFIIVDILVANTPLWIIYPYCYSGYIITAELVKVTTKASSHNINMLHFNFVVILSTLIGLIIVVKNFGKKEMR